jgi:hypothetical protein
VALASGDELTEFFGAFFATKDESDRLAGKRITVEGLHMLDASRKPRPLRFPYHGA